MAKGSWSEIRWRKMMVSYRDPVMREFMDTGSIYGQMMEYTQKACAQCRWSFFQTSMQHIRKIHNTTDIPQNKPTTLQVQPRKKAVFFLDFFFWGGAGGGRRMCDRDCLTSSKNLNFNTSEDNYYLCWCNDSIANHHSCK